MDHSRHQQSVEQFVTIICGGEFAERLAQAFIAKRVPIDTPKLSIVLENRSALRRSCDAFGPFGAAQRHYAMMKSFVRLIRGCERLGAFLVEAGRIPSDEALDQLKQAETQRRQQALN